MFEDVFCQILLKAVLHPALVQCEVWKRYSDFQHLSKQLEAIHLQSKLDSRFPSIVKAKYFGKHDRGEGVACTTYCMCVRTYIVHVRVHVHTVCSEVHPVLGFIHYPSFASPFSFPFYLYGIQTQVS